MNPHRTSDQWGTVKLSSAFVGTSRNMLSYQNGVNRRTQSLRAKESEL